MMGELVISIIACLVIFIGIAGSMVGMAFAIRDFNEYISEEEKGL